MALRTSLARLAAVALAGCVPADDDTSGAASATAGATSDADATTDASTVESMESTVDARDAHEGDREPVGTHS